MYLSISLGFIGEMFQLIFRLHCSSGGWEGASRAPESATGGDCRDGDCIAVCTASLFEARGA